MYNRDMNLFLKKSTFYFLLAGTIGMMVLLLTSGKDLKTTTTPFGIIDLELAFSKPDVQKILTVWDHKVSGGKNLITKAQINTLFDFIFLLFYSLLLFACCKILASSLAHRRKWRNTLNLFAVLVMVSGLLDVVENTGMLLSLSRFSFSAIAPITAIAAYLKWAIVISTLLVIVTALIVKLLAMKKGNG